jgi:transposase
MEAIKQSVGIDVSMDELEVTLKERKESITKIKGIKKFVNSVKGFEQIVEWSEKREKTDNITYVMEATGVYHEELLYFLHSAGKKVCLELAQRIKYFAKSKGIKTKNDVVDSGVIAEYGLERVLKVWQPPSPEFKQLRDLSREHSLITELKVMARNRLHAASCAYKKDEKVKERLQKQIDFQVQQLEEIDQDIQTVLQKDIKLQEKVAKIGEVKGLGVLSIVKIIAETGGFYLFNNINQLVSYAGLDVIENQSGKHKGKTRISKKGNSNLRTILYMPALSAIRCCQKMKAFNERIMKNHQFKKQGIVAVMRKLLILVYTLWKKDVKYDPNYMCTNVI